MYHPSRGGVRGGRDQFNWEDVKADKHRENYLGHSIKAPVGRWQKGKDLYWYTKQHGSEGSVAEEIRRVKEEEEDAMKEMLGLAPRKNKRTLGSQLDKREVDELLKKGKSAEEQPPAYLDGERVQGLGYAPAPGQTGGQAGSRRAMTTVSTPLENTSTREKSKDNYEGKRQSTQNLPVSSEAGKSEDNESSEDGRLRNERRKAKEFRREAKRAKKETRKGSKEDRGYSHRSSGREENSSRHADRRDSRRPERNDGSPGYRDSKKERRYRE